MKTSRKHLYKLKRSQLIGIGIERNKNDEDRERTDSERLILFFSNQSPLKSLRFSFFKANLRESDLITLGNMAANFTPMLESLVWVEDPEETWSDGDQIKVICTSGKITYTGNILIAENPFRKLPHLYDIHMVAQYEGEAFGELSPHPFAVADASYRLMINEGISQSILVGGESEAGKTESRKLLMRCLAYMGGRGAAQGRSVELKVLDSNPVLEAFGNTKTARNNKSGRFGKFLEIQIDRSGRFSGAEIRTCLLEGSRACQVSDPEVDYHGFYMLRAAPPEDIQFKLGNPRSLYYLNQSNPYELDGVDDSKEYTVTRQPMDLVGSRCNISNCGCKFPSWKR